jgi:iron complex outermembrane receptor protein
MNMIKTLSLGVRLAFVILDFSIQSFAQKSQGIIKGKIIAADGTAASYVSVELKRHKHLVFSNDQGVFVLQHLPDLQDTLIISSVESNVYKRPVILENGKTIDLGTIRLEYNIKQLQHVEITGRGGHSYKSDYSFFATKTQTALQDIPQSISSVTKELIKDKMEFNLKDVVSDVSGVNQYSGYDEYAIRGFRAENAHDINGLRGYNSTYTSAMLVNIERIEVIKGPTATLYGNCDPGGTINLVTKKPLDKNEAEVNIAAGSWDHFRAQTDITGPVNKTKSLLYRLNIGYDQTNSFRSQLFAKSYQIAPSFSFIPNDKIQVNVDFSLSHVNTVLDRGQPGFQNDYSLKSTPISLMVSQPGDYLKETDIASIVSLSYKINKHISFNSGFLNYITQQDVAEHGIQNYITPDSTYLYYSNWNYHTVTNTLTNYFTFRFNTGRLNHQLLIGYDYIRSRVDLNQQKWELPNDFGTGSGIVGTFSLIHPYYFQRPVNTYQESDVQNDANEVNANIYHTQGIYIQEQLSMGKWKLLGGLRKEFYKGDDVGDSAGSLSQTILIPRLGLVYLIMPNLSLYATYNKGFDPFEASTSAQVFNQPFKPITSELLEFGVKANFFRNKLSASLAIYQLTLQNVAVNANDPSNPNLFIQQGEDQSKGIETELNGNILPNLSVNLSYTYNVAKVLKSDNHDDIGKIKENAPKNISNSWIKYIFRNGPLKNFGIAAGHSQVSQRNTLVDGFTLPGYIVFNGGILYSYKHFNFAANLNNISNQTYWYSAYNTISKWPGALRNFMVNLGYTF